MPIVKTRGANRTACAGWCPSVSSKASSPSAEATAEKIKTKTMTIMMLGNTLFDFLMNIMIDEELVRTTFCQVILVVVSLLFDGMKENSFFDEWNFVRRTQIQQNEERNRSYRNNRVSSRFTCPTKNAVKRCCAPFFPGEPVCKFTRWYDSVLESRFASKSKGNIGDRHFVVF